MPSNIIPDGPYKIVRDHILSGRNFDCDALPRAQFEGCVNSRIQACGSEDVDHYVDALEVKPSEYTLLFNCLFNETKRFGLHEEWSAIQNKIVQALSSSKERLRLWAVNCGDGHEAVIMCILLAEAMGLSAVQQRVRIFGTDTREDQLLAARLATYPLGLLSALPQSWISQYFVVSNEQATFRTDLRRTIIYGKHDVLEDPPISKMDLVVARYVLPYFDLDKQQTIQAKLNFACRDRRFLWVGLGEQLSPSSGFRHSDEMPELYFKSASDALPEHREASAGNLPGSNQASTVMQESAFDQAGVSQLVIDSTGIVAMANSKARGTFGLRVSDFGRPLQDLEISYRPVELRSAIEAALHREDRQNVLKSVPFRNGETNNIYFDVHIRPLYENGGDHIGTCVQYVEVTQFHTLRDELLSVNQQLQTANEELQSAHEELETTNEELQSTNEELETTNEELQSTNQELETMNEELRSTNNELERNNFEQQVLMEQMNKTNQFLEGILASIPSAVIVMSSNFQIQIWNRHASELFGLLQDEVVDQNLFSLDIGLPVEQLKQPLKAYLQRNKESEEFVLPAINRRGKRINCRVRIHALSTVRDAIVLVVEENQEPS